MTTTYARASGMLAFLQEQNPEDSPIRGLAVEDLPPVIQEALVTGYWQPKPAKVPATPSHPFTPVRYPTFSVGATKR